MTSVMKSAREKAMDYLAIRDHSRLELETKLSQKNYTPEEIATALDSLEASGFLASAESLSEKVSENLHQKGKSYTYIEQYLESKGLPPVPRDSELELEKAEKLIKSHFSKLSKSSETDKKKMAQFLQNRGFDTETIMKALPSSLIED